MLIYRRIIKVLLGLAVFPMMLSAQAYPVAKCQLGQKCLIPIENGIVGSAEFTLLAPFVGNYQCTFTSADPSKVSYISVSAANYTDGYAPNLAAIVPVNSVNLPSGVPESFKVDWQSPNQAHPNVVGVSLVTAAAVMVDNNIQLFVTCNKG